MVLRRSLAAVCPAARLRVLALGDDVAGYLRGLDDPGISVITEAELLDREPGLTGARAGRSHREWCWTLSPSLCKHALTGVPEGASMTLVDADIAFFASPERLIGEMGDGSGLLVAHRYKRQFAAAAAPGWLDERYGSINGGTVVLRNDRTGRRVASEWAARTLEWCHDSVAEGRYGNQRYLEPLSTLPDVRVARAPVIGLAPWNVGGHRLSGTPAAPLVDGNPAVFFHFQSLRLVRRRGLHPRMALPPNYVHRLRRPTGLVGRVSPWFHVAAAHRRLLWGPYIRRVAHEAEALGALSGAWWAATARMDRRAVGEDWRIRRRLARDRLRRHVP